MKTKTTFLMHNDWIPLFMNMEAEQAGLLMQAVCAYQLDKSEPEKSSPIFAPFMMIKTAMDSDLEKYQNECERRKENINKRWGKEDTSESENIQEYTSVYKCKKSNTKHTDCDATQSQSQSNNTSVKEKDIKHIYGEYKHILLTDKEYQRLVDDYGEAAVLDGIQNVDEYCQEHGKKYKDYNLTLRKWGIKTEKITKPKEKPPDRNAGLQKRVPYPEGAAEDSEEMRLFDADMEAHRGDEWVINDDGYWEKRTVRVQQTGCL